MPNIRLKPWPTLIFLLGAVLNLIGNLIGAPTPARASAFVPMADVELAKAAPVIIEATVVSREPSPDRPAIDYLVEIDELIKGFLPGSALIVRTPGGVSEDGRALHLLGVPRFAVDERLLLFLTPRADGTFGLHQMALGAFRFHQDGDRTVLWRDLAGARASGLAEPAAADDRGRELASFRAWLRGTVAGQSSDAEYFVALPEAVQQKIQRKFNTIVSSTELPPLGCGETGGHRVRWFEFDRGNSLSFLAHVDGQPGLPQTSAVLKQAVEAWNRVPETNIRYQRGGLTQAAAGLTEYDGVNALLFEDPNNEIAGSFEGSGFLALGGPWFSCDLIEHDGEMFHPIFGGDVVFQDGLERLFGQVDEPVKAAEELFAHELGHTLGLAHSDENEALMSADLHADGRGATLDADDIAAVRSLYEAGAGTLVPIAPSNLWAAGLDHRRVRLAWQDNADDETGFRIDIRLDGSFIEIPVAVPADVREVHISGLEAGTEYTFRVRARNAFGSSTPSNVVQVRTFAEDAACTQDGSRLCLLDGRFEVRVRYIDPRGNGGESAGQAVPGTRETGMFWFFQQENIELAVKVLDGSNINGHFWVLYGALSDVEYWIDVTDHETGETKTYYSPPGEICGQADNRAFAAPASDQRKIRFERLPTVEDIQRMTVEPLGKGWTSAKASPDGACEASNERLCLLDGRFSAEVEWRDPNGSEGFGRAIAGTGNSGYFWFFTPGNLELSLKVLDGRGINGKFWVFYGALSDVEYHLHITDTLTGERKTYSNPAGEICGMADTSAFTDPAP